VPSIELPPVIIPIAWLLTLLNVIFLIGLYRLTRNHLYIVTEETDDHISMRCVGCRKRVRFYLEKEGDPAG